MNNATANTKLQSENGDPTLNAVSFAQERAAIQSDGRAGIVLGGNAQRKIKALSALGIFALFSGCTQLPTAPVETPKERIALSWEAKNPERKEWSDVLIQLIENDSHLFAKAKDITELCPKYHSLTEAQKTKAVGEFFVALAFYESAWNPKSQSVDVGTKENRNSWSIGLYQISQRDQSWVKADRVYTFEELLTPIPNIKLGFAVIRRQIDKTSEIILPNKSKFRYFAVLLEGNRYSKIPQIIERVKKNAPECGK